MAWHRNTLTANPHINFFAQHESQSIGLTINNPKGKAIESIVALIERRASTKD